MSFPFILSIPDAEIYNTYSDRRFMLGQEARTLDGRVFRFAKAGASDLVAGDVLQAPAPVTNHVLQTATAAGKVGDTTVTLTIGATAITADQYRDGVLAVELGTGFGYAYALDTHVSYLASATTVAIPFKRGITLQVAVPTTANTLSLIASPYSGVIQSPTTLTAQPVGVAVSVIKAAKFGWIQVRGLAAVTTIGTVVIGSNVMVPTTTAGGCAPVAADTTPVIGTVAHVATTTNKSVIQLMLP